MNNDHEYKRHQQTGIFVLAGLWIVAAAFVAVVKITNPVLQMPAEWVPCREVVLKLPFAWSDAECPHPEHRIRHAQENDYVCTCYTPDELGMPVVKDGL